MSSQNRKTTIIAGLAVIAIIATSSTFYLIQSAIGSHPGNGQNQSGQNARPITTAGTGATIPVFGQAANAYSSGNTNSARTITVTGTGQVSFVPSEALIALSVVTSNTTAGAATSANAAITINVIKALNSIGIANGTIQTTGFTLYPNYNSNYNNYQPPQILGYTVTNSLQVNVTGISADKLGVKAGQVIDTAVKAGANQVNLAFTVPNQMLAQLNNEALQQAVSSASSQAQTIAKALGVTIAGVLAVNNGYGYYQPQQYGPYASAVMTVTQVAAAQGAIPTAIVPGTLTAGASVQVTYSIG